MQERPLSIFVLDDDPASRMAAGFALDEPGYAVREFGCGEDCLAALEEKPDLILVDVEMPGMDGIAFCRALRAAGEEHAEVIFLSAHNDLETRMAAYEAGGDDYLIKPCAREDLLCKVKVAERSLGSRHGLAAQAGDAMRTAFTAMSAMGEMGVLLEFLRTSSACQTHAQLVESVFHVLRQYGLEGLVELRTAEGDLCFSMHGVCSELEKSIVSHVRNMERIFQFRERLVINYPRVVLLIQNLPLDDPDRVGRLRDHLAMLVEGIQPRLHAMEGEIQRQRQTQGILAAVAELTQALAGIEVRQGENRFRALAAGNGFLERLELSFVHLGLSQSQEQELAALARTSVERITDVLGEDKSLGEQLLRVVTRLRGLAGGVSG